MSKKGHIPIRTCIGCRKRRKKDEMIWLTQSLNGVVSIHEKKNPKGRGFYLCPDRVCLKKAQKRNKMGWTAATDEGMATFCTEFSQR